MANKVRDLFLKNLIFKLLALLFAILLWWMVTSVSDPTQYKTFPSPSRCRMSRR